MSFHVTDVSSADASRSVQAKHQALAKEGIDVLYVGDGNKHPIKAVAHDKRAKVAERCGKNE